MYKPLQNNSWYKLLCFLLPTFLITACSGGGQNVIDLMPAPAVFADGDVNPLPKGTPPVSYDDFRIFFATDRKPSDNPDGSPFYLNEPGHVVRLGQARVKAGPPGTDWESARRVSLAQNRSGKYPLKVISVQEIGFLPSTYSFLTRSVPELATYDGQNQNFADRVNQYLSTSGVKDVYIYVHGFRVVFDIPVLVSSELWHFLGYRGAFIAYSWPSTPSVFAYLSDLEAAVFMARQLRLFLNYLAEETEAERIHLIAFSAGSRLVVRTLSQLALINSGATDDQIRDNIRISNVIIIGGDISRAEFGAAMADGILRISERMTVYVSSADSALNWARRLFRRERIGQMWDETWPARTDEFIRSSPSLELIDVTEASGSTSGNGHNYFRQSTWVSSDLLMLLAYDLGANERGLVKDEDLLVWKFPPNFIEHLKQVLIKQNYAEISR